MLSAHTIMDWLQHTLLAILTVFLVNREMGLRAVFLGVLMNIIYLGQYLNQSQREQYCHLAELVAQFSQAICNPGLAFFMAAVNSYFSLVRMKISLAAMLLSYYRSTIAAICFESTGFQASWAVLEMLQEGKVILEVQLTFGIISGVLKATTAYRQWEQTHLATRLNSTGARGIATGIMSRESDVII